MYTTNRFVLQELEIFTWRVSDCEELVGIIHRRRWVGFLVFQSIFYKGIYFFISKFINSLNQTFYRKST